MSGLVVDAQKCVGCRRCVRVCANDGIEVTNRKAHVLDGCISCGMCVDACPVGALSIEKDASGAQDLAAYHDIWVFCQVGGTGSVMDVALELVGKGRTLADARGCRLVALLGEGAAEKGPAADDAPVADPAGSDPNVRLLLAAGADSVIRCVDRRLASADSEVFADWIRDLAAERKPEVILYGATDFGRELAPRVAALLQTGLTADCTILEMDEERGLLQQTRPAFGGNLMATIVCPGHRPQMATVRPGIFPVPAACDSAAHEPAACEHAASVPAACDSAAHGPEAREDLLGKSVVDVALDRAVRPRVRVMHVEPKGADGSITAADALVVVGRGIGSKKALSEVRRLAELIGERLGCTCDIGCTRPVVEAGWLGYEHQVGQTGVSVAPRLLVSLGCSGAIQHLAGIGGAKVVVAVNEDAGAPIFDVAQYKVVGDCAEVVSALIERLGSR